MAIPSNRLHKEALRDQTMGDVHVAAAMSDSPQIEHNGMFFERNTCRERSIPAYSSKPDAPAILYLDFTGRAETAREYDHAGAVVEGCEEVGSEPIEGRSVDDSCEPNAIEAQVIEEIWQAFVVKLAPLNVNVTTVNPGDFSGRNARRVAVRALFLNCYRSMLQYR